MWHDFGARWLRPLLVLIGVVAICTLVVARIPATTPKPGPTEPLLHLVTQKDGDSFIASDGKEYRLGLVNTPELDEPCGREAREFSRRFLASGLRVDAYASDPYGRRIAEVFDRSGESLNVALAESGYGDDRYLRSFRDENRDLAWRLDTAFAQARKPACSR